MEDKLTIDEEFRILGVIHRMRKVIENFKSYEAEGNNYKSYTPTQQLNLLKLECVKLDTLCGDIAKERLLREKKEG